MRPEEISIPPGNPLSRLPLLAGGAGLAALVVSFVLGRGASEHFWHAYLVSCLFFLSLSLGGLFFVLLQFATRAGWSVVVRRLAEQVMGTLPVVAGLMVPLGWGLPELYPWARPESLAGDPLFKHKQAYLSPSFFYLRSLIYLGGWSLTVWWFRRQSLRQDEAGDPAMTRRAQLASAPALVFFGLTVTFAAFDWIMSLDPQWYSTIFGVYFFAGSVVSILAFLLLLILGLQRAGLLSSLVTLEHFHDLAKLLFGFVAFWAYIAFSQFMLIWYGNIPEETIWYARRLGEGWATLSVLLALGHFALPFFFFLPRDFKRKRPTLLAGAAWLLAMHYLDLYWLVMPNLHPEGPRPHLLDAATFAAVGGLFLGALGLLMRRRPLVPIGDPRLSESLSFENR